LHRALQGKIITKHIWIFISWDNIYQIPLPSDFVSAATSARFNGSTHVVHKSSYQIKYTSINTIGVADIAHMISIRCKRVPIDACSLICHRMYSYMNSAGLHIYHIQSTKYSYYVDGRAIERRFVPASCSHFAWKNILFWDNDRKSLVWATLPQLASK
jgi:hypothetical protein